MDAAERKPLQMCRGSSPAIFRPEGKWQSGLDQAERVQSRLPTPKIGVALIFIEFTESMYEIRRRSGSAAFGRKHHRNLPANT